MAGLDLDALRVSVESCRELSPERRREVESCRDQVLAHLGELAALNDMDKAAAAYFIVRLLKTILVLHMYEVSQVLADTTVGYTLAAAKLVGLDD
jgi:hypothetical protein